MDRQDPASRSSRPRSTSWHDFFGNILPAHALRGSDLTQVWSDRIDDPRTGRTDRKWPVPRPSPRLERGRQLVLRRNPRYWGPHPAYRRAARHQIRAVPRPHDPRRGAEEPGEIDVAFGEGSSRAVVPAVRRAAGVRAWSRAQAPAFEHLDIQFGPDASPERFATSSFAARSRIGIDRFALALIPTDTGRGRPFRGSPSSTARYHLAQSTLLQTELGRVSLSTGRGPPPAHASGLHGEARTASSPAAGSVSRCASLTIPGGVLFRAQALPLIQAQLRAARGRGRAGVSHPRRRSSARSSPGRVPSTSHSSRGQAHAGVSIVGPGVSAAMRPVDFTGYCQRLVTADFNQADRILDERQPHARVFNRADHGGSRVTCQRSRYFPVPVFTAALRHLCPTELLTVFLPLGPFLERGELVARRLALTAAIAVSLLAVSGASGAGAQTPKRGGTVVVASTPTEPACLNPLNLDCIPGTSQITALRIVNRVLEAPFDVDFSFRWREQLVSGVEFTTKPPFTLTYHIRPEARWSDGVPITAADFVFTHEAQRTYGSESGLHRTMVKSVRTLDRKTVHVVLRRPGFSLAGYAVAEETAPWRNQGPRDGLARRDRRPEDGQAHRERPVPRPARRNRQADHASPESELLGSTTGLPRPSGSPLRRQREHARRRLPNRRHRRRGELPAKLLRGSERKARCPRTPGSRQQHRALRAPPRPGRPSRRRTSCRSSPGVRARP